MQRCWSKADVLERWGWVYENGGDRGGFTSGEFVLPPGGDLLMRIGGSSTRGGETTWRFNAWSPMTRWEPTLDVAKAMSAPRMRGYALTLPGPTAVMAREHGPVPGLPANAIHL